MKRRISTALSLYSLILVWTTGDPSWTAHGFVPVFSTQRSNAWLDRHVSEPRRHLSSTAFVLPLHEQISNDDANDDDNDDISMALDPYSDQARDICCLGGLQLTPDQFSQLQQLTELIVEWNLKINLVSRKDCHPSTVFARHVLPSLALAGITNDNDKNILQDGMNVLDVGTGGGFPGLPLSIQYPKANFVLMDSIGKKIHAVENMAQTLAADYNSNVRTVHGRVEDLYYQDENDNKPPEQLFDIITGRSVTSIGQFCALCHGALKPNTGKLVYWTGGDELAEQQELAEQVLYLHEIFPSNWKQMDKKVLVFSASAVQTLAQRHGKIVRPNPPKKSNAKPRASHNKKKKPAKGAWRDRDGPKQRGYEGFQRYDSSSPAGALSSETKDATD